MSMPPGWREISRVAPGRARQYAALLHRYLGSQRGRVLVMAALLLGGIGLQLVGPQILRGFIDAVQRGSDTHTLAVAAFLYLLSAVVAKVVSALATYQSEGVAWTATNQLRTDLFRHSLDLDLAFHKERTPGELLERVDGDAEALAGFFSQFVVRVAGNTLLLLGILLLVAREDARVGGVLALYTALTVAVIWWIQTHAVPAFKSQRQATADLSGLLGEVLAAREDLVAGGAGSYILRRYFGVQRKLNRASIVSKAWVGAFEGAWELANTGGLALVLAVGALLYASGSLSLGTVFLLFSYTLQLINNTAELTAQIGSLQQATAAVERIAELLQTTSRIRDGRGCTLSTGPLAVEVQGISFSYAPDRPALRDLSFDLAPGEVLAIVGRSGSGKTTIARLLLRFYEPDAGAIRVGGVDVRDATLAALRDSIGLVSQDVPLWGATVRENIALFDRHVSDEAILRALGTLGMGTWIDRLPDRLDTVLSRQSGISAGEAQLLTFARILLKDPRMVILDEATSRLDPATEQVLLRATRQVLTDRTGIIITHRRAMLDLVDWIIVLEDGRVVESGRREDVLARPFSRATAAIAAVEAAGEMV